MFKYEYESNINHTFFVEIFSPTSYDLHQGKMNEQKLPLPKKEGVKPSEIVLCSIVQALKGNITMSHIQVFNYNESCTPRQNSFSSTKEIFPGQACWNTFSEGL